MFETHEVLEEIVAPSPVFELESKRRGAYAWMVRLLDDVFLVLPGSQISCTETASCPERVTKRRLSARNTRHVVDWVVAKPITFQSASAASAFVQGSAPGSVDIWKTVSNGIPYSEVWPRGGQPKDGRRVAEMKRSPAYWQVAERVRGYL